MFDSEIRASYKKNKLVRGVSRDHKIVDELHLPCAGVRADIAVINGSLHGVEIKGSNDTLKRLSSQIDGYSKVFDYVTIVTVEKHITGVQSEVPNWVSIVTCQKNEKGVIVFDCIRHGSRNPTTNATYVANLLWREELIDVLNEYNIRYRQQDRNWILCTKICASLNKKLVSKIVRDKLKERAMWKTPLQ